MPDRWFPVARSEEVVRRHVVQTQLLEREIALWRDDTGDVNAWENRCPHRGVRLSIGINTGSELRCRYHGWRFAGGTGRCTYIPAHPSQRPASTLHATVHRAADRQGFVWISFGGEIEPPPWDPPAAMTLRSIFANAPAGALHDRLLRGYRLDATTGGAEVTARDEYTLTVAAGGAGAVIFLQPVAQGQTVMHSMIWPEPPPQDRIAVLRFHNAQQSRLRDDAEQRRP
jgi:nitrite reductase/ring-hydroxylating ferredoxin subunit